MKDAAGKSFKVYAVYASSASDDDYAKHVFVVSSEVQENNDKNSVASLAKTNKDGRLENIVLTAPFEIRNLNGVGKARVPFTVYFVSADVSDAPVFSAQYVNALSDTSVASGGCTILSAERNM